MGRFAKTKEYESKLKTNLAGGQSYSYSPQYALVTQLVNSFVTESFYESETTGLDRLANAVVNLEDKKFAAKAAIFSRNQFNMRTSSHVVAGEIAHLVSGEDWTRNFYEKVIIRPDDAVEIMGYFLSRYTKKKTSDKGKVRYRSIPNSLKAGIMRGLQKFDTYQLRKYKCSEKNPSLVDVINICGGIKGPVKAVEGKINSAIGQLLTGTLPKASTWETKISAAGQEAKTEEEKGILKSEGWKDLIDKAYDNKKGGIGYMALLKNMRNIMQQSDEKTLKKAYELLQRRNLIQKSRLLPFRFFKAYDQLGGHSNSREVLEAIGNAADIALSNCPEFDGKTLIVLDASSSMGGTTIEIACMFAAILYKANKTADFMYFNSHAWYQQHDSNMSVISLAHNMRVSKGWTDMNDVFRKADKAYDRIIIISDNESWRSAEPGHSDFKGYCQRFDCKPKLYNFDIERYGEPQFPQNAVYNMSGWSEKAFDIMALLESDKNAMITEIEKIQI